MNMSDSSIIGTVRLLDVRYTIEDDGDGGSMQVYSAVDANGAPEPYADETIECSTVRDAADAITAHDCSMNVGSWYADPDGSYTVDYRTGEESEHTAHLSGFSDDELDAIDALVREG